MRSSRTRLHSSGSLFPPTRRRAPALAVLTGPLLPVFSHAGRQWFTQLTTTNPHRRLMADTTVNQALQLEDGMHGLHNRSRVTAADSTRDPAGTRGAPDSRRRPWSLLVLLSVAQFMVILDATVVNVALPAIARSLSFGAGGLPAVFTAYVLASGGLVLLGGRAADPAGRRPSFLAGAGRFNPAIRGAGPAPPPARRWSAQARPVP